MSAVVRHDLLARRSDTTWGPQREYQQVRYILTSDLHSALATFDVDETPVRDHAVVTEKGRGIAAGAAGTSRAHD